MRPESVSEEDRPAALTPPVRPSMPWRVASVAARPGFCLDVTFIDGSTGVVDLSTLIASPNAGVFAGLRDPDAFSKAYLEYGAVTWPGEIDLAPDAMYVAIKKTGRWTPG